MNVCVDSKKQLQLLLTVINNTSSCIIIDSPNSTCARAPGHFTESTLFSSSLSVLVNCFEPEVTIFG